MTTPAHRERERLAEALRETGPDAPTLCEGWTTRDLAGHVVARDRRPDTMPGLVVKGLAGWTERVRRQYAARPWYRLVDEVGEGPPSWWPTHFDPVDRMVNTIELYVHHEDVRRAQPDWTVRTLDDDLADDLDGALRRTAKMFGRRSPVGLVLQPDGREPVVARAAEPSVTVAGPVGELVLWIFGRQEHARVGFVGDDAAIAALRATKFGL